MYTAFPDLASPPHLIVKGTGGRPDEAYVGGATALAPFAARAAKPPAADAPLTGQVRSAQLAEGVRFVAMYHTLYRTRGGLRAYADFDRYADVCRRLPGLSADHPGAERDGVVLMKCVEEYAASRTDSEETMTDSFTSFVVLRLDVEADLLAAPAKK